MLSSAPKRQPQENQIADMTDSLVSIDDLTPDARNARRRTARSRKLIAESIAEFGPARSGLVDEDLNIIAGNGTAEGLAAAGITRVRVVEPEPGEWVVVKRDGLTEEQKKRLALIDNRSAELSVWDSEILLELKGEGFDLSGLFDDEEVSGFTVGGGEPKEYQTDKAEGKIGSLFDRFLVPPFTVLDSRQGYWQDRKRAWLALGIEGETGRGENLTLSKSALPSEYYNIRNELRRNTGGVDPSWEEVYAEAARRGKMFAWVKGTSIFDPVLCELAYAWFSPPGGRVLDLFAGGSVRGIVAQKLGRYYTGIELRKEQVTANEDNWGTISDRAILTVADQSDNTPECTPIERHGNLWVKRDDLFRIAGVAGGKVRSCWNLAQGATGLITAGSRSSSQVNIVAHIARRLNIPCRVHIPSGSLSPEVLAAKGAGAEIVQHKAGYNTVIVARAREDAEKSGWREIPFVMECREAVDQTAAQVCNLPSGVQRIVIPVGSGMSLAGLLTGLERENLSIPVLGIQVGADPTKRLAEFAPKGWENRVTLVKSPQDYHEPAPESRLGRLMLDPHYEAKCLPYLQEGDLFWCVGISQTAAVPTTEEPPAPRWVGGDSRNVADLAPGKYDFIFTCPPYADLERYSDDPRDISTMEYSEFLQAFREIIAAGLSLLLPDRFAAIVVGDVRDAKGFYRGLVADTVRAFEDAGAKFYNEGILITQAASLPIRAGKQFVAGRKLGKSHQHLLVFVKGDPKRATRDCGPVEIAEFGEAGAAEMDEREDSGI